MGRAFPKLEMTPFFESQNALFPLVAFSEEETLIVTNYQQMEENLHPFMLRNNGYCHVACYGMNGYQMKAAMISGTLKLARDLGEALSTGSIQDKLYSLRNLFSNSVYGELQVAFWGSISSIHRWFEKEVLVGSCHLIGQWSFHGESADVYFQNEFLSFRDSRKRKSATPDLILFLHYETGIPVSVSDIREGMFVVVLIVPAPGVLYTKGMLRKVGPASFDIPEEFRPTDEDEEGPYNEDWD